MRLRRDSRVVRWIGIAPGRLEGESVRARTREGRERDVPVSQICSRTTVSVSESTTRFVMKLAPTVDVTCDGLKAPLQYRITSDVLPTPWEPRMTILASSEDISVSFFCFFLPLSFASMCCRVLYRYQVRGGCVEWVK